LLSRFRDPVSGLTHLGAAVAAFIGLLVMLWLSLGDTVKAVSILIYGISLVLMFLASAIYHLANPAPVLLQRLRKLDHSAIYALIAGTYTPICFHFFRGTWRWGLPVVVWLMALVGIIVKLFVIRAPRWVSAGVYLVMGWLSVMASGEMVATMPPAALALLVAGGLFFTVGAVVYITKKPDFYPGVFGFHELWHIFVILGCLSHFLVIALYVVP
jgi:hemolysin III